MPRKKGLRVSQNKWRKSSNAEAATSCKSERPYLQEVFDGEDFDDDDLISYKHGCTLEDYVGVSPEFYSGVH